MNVTVYTQLSCMPCVTTKRKLDKLKIPYTAIDITEDEKATAFVKSLGYSSAPVVVAELSGGIEHWSGFRSDRIDWLRLELDAIEYLDTVRPGGEPA
ncbi:glutaredoxin family protein [Rhodococcus globerulus]|uniref:glutaredoxin family protein n=1 Tax=Rhodococcus globerulus TaxID=33008 RepID=UPI001C5788CC|nr:glutaredoxin family protein [Rhodococcus globerulus]QXW04034.1 glutaredoxin family protein [Rhodococcus globerulus]